jgi:hypothetical protein
MAHQRSTAPARLVNATKFSAAVSAIVAHAIAGTSAGRLKTSANIPAGVNSTISLG